MKPEVKKLNPAEEYVKAYRMRFASLYSSDLCFFVNGMLPQWSGDLLWKDGELVDSKRSAMSLDSKVQITEDGWEFCKNNNPPLSQWQVPSESNCLLAIPDDAAKHWLDFISHQAFAILRYDLNNTKDFLASLADMSTMTAEYKKQHYEANWEAFQKVREAAHYIWNRVRFIEQERQNKKRIPKPLVPEQGSTVRTKTGHETAIILRDDIVFGNKRIKGACYLNKPLEGTKYWAAEDLVVVTPPSKTS